MEASSKAFSEKFCREMIQATELNHNRLFASIKSDLQLYDEEDHDGKLNYMNAKKKELRAQLTGSVYKADFPIKGIENELMGCLDQFFNTHHLRLAKAVEYSKALRKGQYQFVLREKKLIVCPTYSSMGAKGKVPGFRFSDLKEFKPLVEYIEWGYVFLELNKLSLRESKGNPKKEFQPVNSLASKTTLDFLIGSEEEKKYLLDYLKKFYSDKKGKYIAIMILVLIDLKLIALTNHTELYAALRNDLGTIGTDSGINKYLAIGSRKDKELLKLVSLHTEKLEKHRNNWSPKVVFSY